MKTMYEYIYPVGCKVWENMPDDFPEGVPYTSVPPLPNVPLDRQFWNPSERAWKEIVPKDISELETIKSNKKMYVRRLPDTIEIISKYNQRQDLLFTFGIISKNKTWQISNSYLLPNDEIYPSSDFSRNRTLLNKVFTDYVSPYHQLRALQNIDGDKPKSADYTGGWHAYNNDSAGGDENTPTSTIESLKIFVDNVEIDLLDQIIGGDEIKIVTTNLVQGTNTKKADGSGRAILREKVTYLVIGGKIQVVVELTALEPLTMKGYYFLQASNSSSYSKALLPVDDNLYLKTITEFTENIYGGGKGESYCSQMILTDNMNQLTIGIDQIFNKLVAIDGLIFLPLTVILIGFIIFASWRINIYYRKELHDERENSKQDRRDFLATLSEIKNELINTRSDVKRIDDKVNEIEKEVRK